VPQRRGQYRNRRNSICSLARQEGHKRRRGGLARLGHQCVGIDYSPASIIHARALAAAEGLDCHFEQADLRQADFGQGFDLVMQIFGELNVFAPAQAAALLRKAHAALQPGDTLSLEVHTLAAVQALGTQPATWKVAAAGLFAPTPHLLLSEAFWDADQASPRCAATWLPWPTARSRATLRACRATLRMPTRFCWARPVSPN
jgi:hypothetical protein